LAKVTSFFIRSSLDAYDYFLIFLLDNRDLNDPRLACPYVRAGLKIKRLVFLKRAIAN